MNSILRAIGVAVVLLGADSARADLGTAFSPTPPSRPASLEAGVGAKAVSPWLGDLTRTFPWHNSIFNVMEGISGVPAAPAQPQAITELAPGPSGASLALLGLSTLGVLGIGRSARKVHFTVFAEWCHTGGPTQIGHAVPLDLDMNALPVCCFEQPVGQRLVVHYLQRELPLRWDDQFFLMRAAPRGPPLSF